MSVFSRIAFNSCLFVMALSAQGQTVRPESVGLSSERLERIGAFMRKHVEAGDISGGVTLVARHGRIAHLEAHGASDLESGKPMETDTIFRMASMSKPVTALAVMMLVEEGKVRLNDEVASFLPSFAGQKIAVPRGSSPQDGFDTEPAERPITVKDLLTHTSGFMSGPSSNSQSLEAMGRRHELGLAWVDDLGKAPLEFQPGSTWAYSALGGFDVLSRIAEIASGMSFDVFLRERIFAPLDMRDIFFWPNAGQRERLAGSYNVTPDGLQPRPNPDAMSGEHYFSGAGGLMASAEAYAQVAMLMAQGGALRDTRLLGTRTMEVMRSPFLSNTFVPNTPTLIRPGEGFGLGVKVLVDPLAMDGLLPKGTFGWIGFYGTYMMMAPEEELAALMLVQTFIPGMIEDFETAVMQAVIE